MKTPTRHGALRGQDPTGNGWYGAKRGRRKHKGVDYLIEPNECIYACIGGIVRIGNVYSTTRKFKLVEIVNEEYKVKQMYIDPKFVKNGQHVNEGDPLGHSQNISAYHSKGIKMKNHVHVEIYKNGLLTDPEPILKRW